MPRKSANLKEWTRCLEEMKRCKSAAELVRAHGQPAHKLQQGEIQIWHYPLGMDQGFLYAIHAAVTADQLKQLYLHTEPMPDTTGPARLPWWKRLFGPRMPKASDPMRALLQDPDLCDRITAASPQQRQRAAAAVARFTVDRVGLKHPAIDKALSHLTSGSPSDPRVAAAVEELADEFSEQYDEFEESRRTEEAAAPFARAQAANCVRDALVGDTADAVYEAIQATDDRAQVREVVLAALSEHLFTPEVWLYAS